MSEHVPAQAAAGCQPEGPADDTLVMAASHEDVTGDPIPIEVTGQIERGIIPDGVERARWSTVSFPSEGCWNIGVTLGVHSLTATVYVYPKNVGQIAR